MRAILSQFPFLLRGFHSDNGSEVLNESVAGLLQRLLIEQTKSRPRNSNDNGLVESENGAVIRKHMGNGYIAAGLDVGIGVAVAGHDVEQLPSEIERGRRPNGCT